MLWFILVLGGLGAILYFCLSILDLTVLDFEASREHFVKFIKFFIVCLVGVFGLNGISNLNYEEIEKTGDWELISVADTVKISGEGSGGLFYVHVSVDSEDVYSYYYKLDNGGIKKGSVKAENTLIYENNDCTPHIVEYTTYTKNKMNKILWAIATFGIGDEESKSYEIYVPKNSILRTYSLGI